MDALVQRGLGVDQLISSPYRRALETAQIALEAGLAPKLRIEQCLQPGGDHLALIEALDGRGCLGGHEPDLSAAACRLLGLLPGQLPLKKAGLIHLQHSAGVWILRALLRPRLLLDTSA